MFAHYFLSILSVCINENLPFFCSFVTSFAVFRCRNPRHNVEVAVILKSYFLFGERASAVLSCCHLVTSWWMCLISADLIALFTVLYMMKGALMLELGIPTPVSCCHRVNCSAIEFALVRCVALSATDHVITRRTEAPTSCMILEQKPLVEFHSDETYARSMN